jgi:hypothetical protein
MAQDQSNFVWTSQFFSSNKLSILNLNSVCIISVCYNYDTMSSLSLGYCLLSWENFFLYHLSFIGVLWIQTPTIKDGERDMQGGL